MTIDLKIKNIEDWLTEPGKPLIISGPCSAETEEQTLTTARELAENKLVRIYRAGIWKPRTRPNSFEGVGEKGLEWLRKVKDETGLLVATEVANADHVRKAVKYGIDVLWIGARTTTNPFSVQEIAEAIKGNDVIVMIKNPVNPDLNLWIGALERINNAGINKLVAVHRGFSSIIKEKYRNTAGWSLVIELKRLIPDIPVICDPSHIAGNRKYLQEISQKAIDLDMDGLMIETHCDPQKALSDKKQQITPAELNTLIENLITRNSSIADSDFVNNLELLSDRIDRIDDELLEILGQRMDIVREIGKYKKLNNVTILQIKRWSEIIQSRSTRGKQLNLSDEFINLLYQLIHEESILIQTRIMNEKK